MEKREPSCTIGGNVNSYSYYGEQYGGSLKKLKIALSYDSLLGISPEKTIIQKDTCTPVFTEALFTTARTQKQIKYPSTDEWIKMLCVGIYVYIYTHTYTYTRGYYAVLCLVTHVSNSL